MAISTLGAIFTVPLVILPPVSQHRHSLKSRQSRVLGLGRHTVSFISERRPLFSRAMMQSASLVLKSPLQYSRHREKQSPFLMRVSSTEAQTAKQKTNTTIVAPNHKNTPSLDDGGKGGTRLDDGGAGGPGKGGWGGWGGGGGGNWGPGSGGFILFGILLLLSYLKDLEKDKDDEEEREME